MIQGLQNIALKKHQSSYFLKEKHLQKCTKQHDAIYIGHRKITFTGGIHRLL